MKDIIGFILLICLITNDFMEPNETTYIPKAKRSKVCKWLRWMMSYLVSKIAEKVVIQIETGRRRKEIIRGMRGVTTNNWRRSTSNQLVTSASTLVMHAKIDSYENVTRFDTDSAPVGIDNRCTGCISHVSQDFIGPLRDTNRSIKGFGGTRTNGVKIGTLAWKWEDDEGVVHRFMIPNSFYVPTGQVRLLSPQHWAQSQRQKKVKEPIHKYGTISQTSSDNVTLLWNDRQSKLTVPLSTGSNVATFYLANGYTRYDEFCMEANIDGVRDEVIPSTEAPMCKEVLTKSEHGIWSKDLHAKFLQGPDDEDELSEPRQDPVQLDLAIGQGIDTGKKELRDTEANPSLGLLRAHQRFGHISFKKLQWMAKQGILPSTYATCEVPLCPACTYGKMIRRPWRNKPEREYDGKDPNSRMPGELVAVDQLVSPTPGFIAQMTGRLTTRRYKYATVYVDVASRYGYVHLQKSADADETVKGKDAFESHMLSMGVRVAAYHGDNGIFRAHKWVESCKNKQQGLSFSGVNAHHQNGYAEWRIRELQELTRAMLVHASRKWKGSITTNLWPYALRMANEVYNNSPCFQLQNKMTPLQRVSGTSVQVNKKHFKTFGCPVYVLDNQLQLGKPFAKWKERARMGIYLGQSPQHNRNIALVLNRDNGLVSPQFHIICDNNFTTVVDDSSNANWMVRAGFVARKLEPKDDESTQRLDGNENETFKRLHPSEGGEKNPTPSENDQVEGRKRKRNDVSDNKEHATKNNEDTSPRKNLTVTWDKTTTNVTADGLRRSSRLNPDLIPQQKLISLQAQVINSSEMQDIPGEIFCSKTIASEAHQMQHQYSDPMAFKASSDPDTMYMHEAMREPDKGQFILAMKKEVDDQMKNGNFSLIKKIDVPKDKIILPAVWQMKRKRDIKSREIKKYKARLNIDGSKMKKGIHYNQTYAPVASWTSIRILLTLAAAMGWHTKQIDYVLAFPQAPVEKEIYMRIPKGFEMEGVKDKDEYVLKLHRNVYGQKQAGRVWNKYLQEKLVKEVGFIQSRYDECVFYKGRTMYILYTDDSILAGPCQDEIQSIIQQIKNTGLQITEEGDIQDFLGINIVRKNDGSIELSQPHLIDQILHDLKMDDERLKPKDTPSKSSTILTRGDNDKDFDQSFHYRSIIGKLNYLEKGTRSDISYITHQCA